jgi:hypothetical protein
VDVPTDLNYKGGEVKDKVKFKGSKQKILLALAEIIYLKRNDPGVKQIYVELAEYVTV